MYPWWGNSDHRGYISELNFSTVAVVIEARTHICPSASGCCPDPVTKLALVAGVLDREHWFILVMTEDIEVHLLSSAHFFSHEFIY